MGAIYLIRHGQASFGAGDYDKLTKRGVEQAAVLGQALAARGVKPDVVICGGMLRHRETALGCLQAMGLDCEWQSDVAWNEYDHETMVEVYRPRFRNKAVMAAELAASLHPRRAFQDIFKSEEHTYELQYIMRNSYAVFCLKTKNDKNKETHTYKHIQKRSIRPKI